MNKFINGNTYVFTKKKYIKRFGKRDYNSVRETVNAMNGNEVEIIIGSVGKIGKQFVNRSWCKCIKIGGIE